MLNPFTRWIFLSLLFVVLHIATSAAQITRPPKERGIPTMNRDQAIEMSSYIQIIAVDTGYNVEEAGSVILSPNTLNQNRELARKVSSPTNDTPRQGTSPPKSESYGRPTPSPQKPMTIDQQMYKSAFHPGGIIFGPQKVLFDLNETPTSLPTLRKIRIFQKHRQIFVSINGKNFQLSLSYLDASRIAHFIESGDDSIISLSYSNHLTDKIDKKIKENVSTSKRLTKQQSDAVTRFFLVDASDINQLLEQHKTVRLLLINIFKELKKIEKHNQQLKDILKIKINQKTHPYYMCSKLKRVNINPAFSEKVLLLAGADELPHMITGRKYRSTIHNYKQNSPIIFHTNNGKLIPSIKSLPLMEFFEKIRPKKDGTDLARIDKQSASLTEKQRDLFCNKNKCSNAYTYLLKVYHYQALFRWFKQKNPSSWLEFIKPFKENWGKQPKRKIRYVFTTTRYPRYFTKRSVIKFIKLKLKACVNTIID